MELAVSHADISSPAAILIHVIAWGGFVAKARLLVQAGFLNVVLVMCALVGGYFTWFAYSSGLSV